MWEYKKFEALTHDEIFQIFKLRIDTFVVEQQCFYPDIDERDLTCIHYFNKEDGKIAAYARIIVDEQAAKLGRVIVNPQFRGRGLARTLIQNGLDYIKDNYPDKDISLSAQAHLKDFYSSFNLSPASDIYFVDLIPHIDMARKPYALDTQLEG
ncbi:GNAT family N-acetyltransferase [Macrococcoides canis]|uniref:GNAT family N-acetyltransferase n=1 Tax=Macrococcoides canis TaxID=1855823 RepID=UPI001AEBF429|nr:GNAT family N-acetyltransferase [Macrococcus canis]QTQ08666.1 GNAT family N-acetyltransferase [Macrococcus canis]